MHESWVISATRLHCIYLIPALILSSIDKWHRSFAVLLPFHPLPFIPICWSVLQCVAVNVCTQLCVCGREYVYLHSLSHAHIYLCTHIYIHIPYPTPNTQVCTNKCMFVRYDKQYMHEHIYIRLQIHTYTSLLRVAIGVTIHANAISLALTEFALVYVSGIWSIPSLAFLPPQHLHNMHTRAHMQTHTDWILGRAIGPKYTITAGSLNVTITAGSLVAACWHVWCTCVCTHARVETQALACMLHVWLYVCMLACMCCLFVCVFVCTYVPILLRICRDSQDTAQQHLSQAKWVLQAQLTKDRTFFELRTSTTRNPCRLWDMMIKQKSRSFQTVFFKFWRLLQPPTTFRVKSAGSMAAVRRWESVILVLAAICIASVVGMYLVFLLHTESMYSRLCCEWRNVLFQGRTRSLSLGVRSPGPSIVTSGKGGSPLMCTATLCSIHSLCMLLFFNGVCIVWIHLCCRAARQREREGGKETTRQRERDRQQDRESGGERHREAERQSDTDAQR